MDDGRVGAKKAKIRHADRNCRYGKPGGSGGSLHRSGFIPASEWLAGIVSGTAWLGIRATP
jgi:hypothetical protein